MTTQEDTKYPIYSFHARWNQDDCERNDTNATFSILDKRIEECFSENKS